jgi:poly-beta-1,6-N-acetyl-D-glucosamine biosynthesis protein PgaD
MTAPLPRDRFAPPVVPAQTFSAPLIARAASRGELAQALDGALTALLWCGWLYLLVAAVGVFWLPPFVHRLLPVEPPESPLATLLAVLGCAALAVLGTSVIAGRALRDRARFAGTDRPQAASPPADAELARALSAEGQDLGALRRARRIVLHHAADGTLLRADRE